VKEETLLLIKPDGVKRRLIGEVISRIEAEGFEIKGIKFQRLSLKQAQEFYKVHKGKEFYDGLVEFMSSGPVVAIWLEGEAAQDRLRALVGATDPKKAGLKTIRGQFGTDTRHNVVHAANPKENPPKEIDFFFKDHIS
jgi:nucleoside-diphosphate kinase